MRLSPLGQDPGTRHLYKITNPMGHPFIVSLTLQALRCQLTGYFNVIGSMNTGKSRLVLTAK